MSKINHKVDQGVTNPESEKCWICGISDVVWLNDGGHYDGVCHQCTVDIKNLITGNTAPDKEDNKL